MQRVGPLDGVVREPPVLAVRSFSRAAGSLASPVPVQAKRSEPITCAPGRASSAASALTDRRQSG
ncbi:hypothetical protein DIE02_31035 [Burkholderia sp. Bp8991]|nr:hypothetical protein DIE02_31035 [Burkholderia sp. Bp8991]RQS21509.1 hypothetical protein DIE05_31595 [Burkholderia sp. Bp8995]RQS39961.1 hypothetical protein DIE00_32420 [Burkholderia sp. Bp8989]